MPTAYWREVNMYFFVLKWIFIKYLTKIHDFSSYIFYIIEKCKAHCCGILFKKQVLFLKFYFLNTYETSPYTLYTQACETAYETKYETSYRQQCSTSYETKCQDTYRYQSTKSLKSIISFFLNIFFWEVNSSTLGLLNCSSVPIMLLYSI